MSQINPTLLAGINENYPIAGANNSSQGFRDNFSTIKQGLNIAGNELGYLQGKQIAVIGDATGISGVLGSTVAQPAAINLVLSSSGVTAGTYDTENAYLEIVVDAKGRITSVVRTPQPTRPAVDGVHAASSTTAFGNTQTLTIPTFTVDEYGTLTAVDSETFTFGLEGFSLPRGSLIVGHQVDGSKVLPPPTVPDFNPAGTTVLAWDNSSANNYGLRWLTLPEPTPVNPAQVITIQSGTGITVSTDPAMPTVEVDMTKLPEYPSNQTITAGSKLMFFNAGDNTEYSVDISRIIDLVPDETFALEDDPNPTLGNRLILGQHPIVGNRVNGIVLESTDSGPIILRNVQTIDPNFYNPNNPNQFVQLDPADYVIKEQRFPSLPPNFTPAEVTANATAFLKISPNGQMFWSKETIQPAGVTSISAGSGIKFSPIGDITSTGTIRVDFSTEPIQPVDVYSDFIIGMDADKLLYRNTVDKFTFTMRTIRVVDPNTGEDSDRPSGGQLHDPYRTISYAINSIPSGDVAQHYILLLPGLYEENLVVDKLNVYLISLLGPELTRVRGGITLGPDLGEFLIRGINFDISNLPTPPAYIFEASNGVETIRAENCWFYQDPSEDSRLQDIIYLVGDQTGSVSFDNCKFNGKFTNGLEFTDDTGFIDAKVRITNTKSSTNNLLCVITLAGSNTEIANVDLLGQIRHQGGIIDVKNVGGIFGDFSDALWASIDPDVDDLDEMGYVREGIQSTAMFTANYSNFLTLSNVSLRYFIDNQYFATSSIIKTGTCLYSFSNVQRKTDVDTLVGNRYDNHGMAKTDISDFVFKNDDVNGTFSVDLRKSATWDLMMTGDTDIVVTGPITLPNPYADIIQALTVRILVKQDSTGSRALTWATTDGTIVWDGGIAPIMPSAPNSMMLVEMMQIGSYWMARKLVSN